MPPRATTTSWFGPERWSRAWVETAPKIVREVFSITNIVPNVSSAVFRRFERHDVLEIEGAPKQPKTGLLYNDKVRKDFEALRASIKSGGK